MTIKDIINEISSLNEEKEIELSSDLLHILSKYDIDESYMKVKKLNEILGGFKNDVI